MLIEGRPRSGKTTLMHKVTRDWAVKKDVLVGAKLVVLIPLRLFSSLSNDIDLSDIVEYYVGSDKKRRKKVMTYVTVPVKRVLVAHLFKIELLPP